MSLRNRVLLILLVLIVLSQVPFAYRRYKLGRLHSAIQVINAGRQDTRLIDNFVEYKGVAHVHSFLGGHSTGTFQEIIAAAQSNKLDFVLMTEHPAKDFNTAEATLKGQHGGVLFINGNEVGTASSDRLLIFPGDDEARSDGERSTPDVLARRASGLAFIAYPAEFKSWDTPGYKGVEVYNVYTNARRINPLVMFFDGLWSYPTYPDLLFATFYERPTAGLAKWDEAIVSRGEKLTAIAGNDSHANVGISFNESSGKTLIGFKLDPYERSFRLVRLHALVTPTSVSGLDQDSLLRALSSGNCFIGFDLFGDTSGFRFTAAVGDRRIMMGDEVKLEADATLSINVPVEARIVLLKDGVAVQDTNGVRKTEFVAREKGSYRVEVYLSRLPPPVGNQPWIISNPIHLR
ncbi:MAG: hypothetical protein ABR501_00675 [Pyrinomonadaceae bacterium]